MSTPTPTAILTTNQDQRFRELLSSSVCALGKLLDYFNNKPNIPDVRTAIIHALSKLAENPTFHRDIVDNALEPIFRMLQSDMAPQEGACLEAAQLIEAAGALYYSLQRPNCRNSATVMAPIVSDPDSPTDPTGPAPASATVPAAHEVQDEQPGGEI
ncbi:hypothetical protein M408DRAFT_147879 [Serendipita vermifera MAFF 305830]|uniref:Uncharacterized protein n=1 Tax=Serendipita vermifera MAFF 305830 TaxID=933852 RepID=A0A0C3B9G3_SERVB|nr:hypothetical protein M408DRAFT_147879 [Serendipita vermifera MAFF 305830]